MAFSTIQGSGGAPDTFVGTSGVDAIALVDSTGNYFLGAQESADIINLNTSGNPLYTRVVSNTQLKGGQGNDSFTWTSAAATTYVSSFINGNANADTFAFAGTDTFLSSTLQGGQGVDIINGSTSNFSATLVNGNKDNDTLTFNGVLTSASLFGGQGDDTISNATPNANAVTNSVINGDNGNDTITFSFAAKSLNGTSISGGDGIDVIDLRLSGVAGNTVWVNGNDGTDTINGTAQGNASLFGGQGIDTVTSRGAAATASTTIVGGTGADVLTGNAVGVDRFYYTDFGQGGSGVAASSTSNLTGGDTIAAFVVTEDFVGIASSLLSGSTAVAVNAAQNAWNLNTQGVAVIQNAAAVATAANITTAIGTVTGDAGDIAYVALTNGALNAGTSATLVQVTLGSAKVGAGLTAQDTINVLGTVGYTANAAGFSASNIQFI